MNPPGSPSLNIGALLIAPGTPLPPQWLLDPDSFASGWMMVANNFDNGHLEKELNVIGWTFFFIAGRVTSLAFGLSTAGRMQSALSRLIAAARRQRCNCLEIDDFAIRSFLGIPYVRISAHQRHIQKGAVFSGQ